VADRLEFNDPPGSLAWDASHRFAGSRKLREQTISIWTSEGNSTSSDPEESRPSVQNNAGYLDGHVSSWDSGSALTMERALTEALTLFPRDAAPHRDPEEERRRGR
jgi:prepilin-type processing-associated H-X9-DG protein